MLKQAWNNNKGTPGAVGTCLPQEAHPLQGFGCPFLIAIVIVSMPAVGSWQPISSQVFRPGPNSDFAHEPSPVSFLIKHNDSSKISSMPNRAHCELDLNN